MPSANSPSGQPTPPSQGVTPLPPLQGKVLKKVFRAETLQAGMALVRKRMGPEAMIVATRQVPSRRNPDMMVLEILVEAPAPAEGAEPGSPAPQQSSTIGGLGGQLQKVREVVVNPFKYPEMFERLGISPPKGVLMYGPPGTGKTLIARTLAEECGAKFFIVNGPELLGSALGESEKNLRELFEEAQQEPASLIFFDEIDAIAGERDAGSGAERRLVTQFLTLMDGIESRGRLLILAATNRPDSLDSALRRPGRFDREVEIPIPDKEGRYEILQIHAKKMALGGDVDLKKISDEAHGYVGADLANLCKEAGMQAVREAVPDGGMPPPDLTVAHRHFEAAMAEIKPSTMRQDTGAAETPKMTWADVGGLEDVKKELNEAILLPLQRPEIFEKMNIQPSKGVLMAGPPGTGKTLIAKAAAGECGVNFISVSGPSLISKFVGDSEKAIRDVFERARKATPCIIFFDEFDALAPVRGAGSSDNQFADRLVAQLLVEMDGFGGSQGIFCLAATNRPEAIDPAVRRPGRFDKVIEIPLPDEESRKRIFEVHLKDKPVERQVDVDQLVAMSNGLSGAEIGEVCRRAAMESVRNVLAGKGRLEPTISTLDLTLAIEEICKGKGIEIQAQAKKGLRALVVDDTDVAREFTSEALKLADVEPICFSDPTEALPALENESFDLAVLDVDMPKMTGLELLAHIRKVLPNLPVIMATGRKDATTAAQSFRLGATDYLTKPFEPQQLVDAVEKLLFPAADG